MTAEELEAWIADRGLTMEQTARITGYHVTTIHRWRAGITPIPKHALIVFAAVDGALKVARLVAAPVD